MKFSTATNSLRFLLPLLGCLSCFGLSNRREDLERANQPEAALLCGYIKMENMRLTSVEITQRRKGQPSVRWSAPLKNGYFAFADIPLDAYEIDCINANSGQQNYKICLRDEEKRASRIALRETGVYYWGPWALVSNPVEQKGIFASFSFRLELFTEPNLQWVAPLLPTLKNTRWYEIVQAAR
jgi:hypothetical protein